MSNNMKKMLSLITTLAVAFVMCFGTTIAFADDPVTGDQQQPAVEEQQTVEDPVVQLGDDPDPTDPTEPTEPTEPENPVVLTVVNQTGATEKSKEFTQADLQKMATKKYTYSSINNQGSIKTYSTESGILLTTLMSKSGIKMKNNYELFFDTDKPGSVRWADMTATRYYYPNLAAGEPLPGPVNNKAATKGKKVVKAVISLADDKLLFGQAYATDKNAPKFMDGILALGVIYVRDAGPKEACQAPTEEQASIPVGSDVEYGAELSFPDYDKNTNETLYYTINGKKPTSTSAIYNYGPKAGIVNPIKLEGAGPLVVKVFVKGFGKKDSEVASFLYFVIPELSVLNATKKSQPISYFSAVDLEKMATVTATYAGINNQGSIKTYSTESGIPLATLMKKSGIKMKSSYELVFDTDKPGSVRWGDMTATRYYYPNLADGNPLPGPVNNKVATSGKKKVKAVISLADDKLLFGQAYATDKNVPKFLDGIIAGNLIIVQKAGTKPTLKDEIVPSVEPGSTVPVGTEITFPDFDNNMNATLYFTTNGKSPTSTSAIYNYSPKSGTVNPVVLEKTGTVKVKVRERGFGFNASKVKTFTYKVVNAE